MLAQLGLDLATMPKGPDGKVRFDASAVEGSKVVAEITYREWDVKDADGNPTGERGSANDIRNVWLRA